jgi:16S rRNA (cytidine1402-2'-O)-methyltransferase
MNERELNFEGPSPLLYLIATPIGNLGEMSPRALEVLASTDYIAAEDTRNSGQLMAHFKISKPFISCHEHNENEASKKIIALLKEGKKVCYMSDAGYPGISDPGEKLVARAIQNGIKVSVVSGPSAVINALVISGLPTSHFYFEGFLPAKESEKDAELKDLSLRKETIVFYESPHRIMKTLKAMQKELGDRRACICRELSKSHEETIRGTLNEFLSLEEDSLRGEMVIVVEGNKEDKSSASDEKILESLKEKIAKGKKSKEAVKETSEELCVNKNRVYDLSLEIKR